MKKKSRHPHNNGYRNQQPAVSPNSVVISKEELQRLLASDKAANRIAAMHEFNKKFGQDGYSNGAAFLGASSPLFSSGGFVRSNLTRCPEQLTTIYRESWLARKIVDTPAEDMTRAGITLKGNFDPEDLEDMKREAAKHSVMQELADAIRWALLFGGSLALMVIDGEGDRLDQPLDLSLLPPECFQGLLVFDRSMAITPSEEMVRDLRDPDYGLPEYYTIDLGDGTPLIIHHSRLLRFVGRPLPRSEEIREDYWGASELEHILDTLMNHESSTANMAAMIFKAQVSTLKIDGLGEMTSIATDEAKAKTDTMLSEFAHMMSSQGMWLLNHDDSVETFPYNFAGLKEIYEAFMTEVAGAAEIPVTKLFGRSPDGMNATGKADMQNYYDRIAGLQERMLRPALTRLLPVMFISYFGYLPENLDFVFNPLATETPQERAELLNALADPVIRAFSAGMISDESAVAEMKALGEPYGAWTKLAAPKKEGKQ